RLRPRGGQGPRARRRLRLPPYEAGRRRRATLAAERRRARARHADASRSPSLGSKRTHVALRLQGLRERLLVGVLGRLAYHAVERLRVLADEDAPAIVPDAVQDDGRRLRRGHGRVVAEADRELMHDRAELLVAHFADRNAPLHELEPDLVELLLRHLE